MTPGAALGPVDVSAAVRERLRRLWSARGVPHPDLLDVVASRPWSDCGAHMAVVKLKVARIGNSRGVRLPAASLRRYRIGDAVVMEERSDGILLRPVGPAVEKLSWEDTARAMAESGEDWSSWEAAAHDGLESVAWNVADGVRKRVPRARSKPGTGTRK